MKKTVLVSMRIDEIAQRKEVRDSIEQRLLTFLIKSDYFPILIPNILFELNLLEKWIINLKPHSILLSGGNDLGEYQDRDKTESFLLKYAVKNNVPILGICRGMQLIAKEFGAELVPISGFVNTRHKLIGEINHDALFFFNFGIKSCPKSFKVMAKTSEGIIQARKHETYKIQGWMWHAEREKNFNIDDIKRIKEFFR